MERLIESEVTSSNLARLVPEDDSSSSTLTRLEVTGVAGLEVLAPGNSELQAPAPDVSVS